MSICKANVHAHATCACCAYCMLHASRCMLVWVIPIIVHLNVVIYSLLIPPKSGHIFLNTRSRPPNNFSIILFIIMHKIMHISIFTHLKAGISSLILIIMCHLRVSICCLLVGCWVIFYGFGGCEHHRTGCM
jgi:hypothetical protein